MIEVDNLSKRYGDKLAVDALSFTVRSGVVTGFLGPNGAGKSTTMRMIMGLDRPSSGTTRINSRPYEQHKAPLQEIGALLEAKAIHPGRSAYHHLVALAASNGIGKRRVLEVIDMVGLTEVARKRAGGFSLGMGQRLGIASALLGDPQVVMLDEPVNGLDPEGVLWIRNLLKDLADRGRTVFVSSHLMSEMALIAEDLIVIGRGRLLSAGPLADFVAQSSGRSVRVRSPQAAHLRDLLVGDGVSVTSSEPGVLDVQGLDAAEIGERAAASGLVLHELSLQEASLEEAFMELTRDAVEYHATTAEFATTGGTNR
ncbi:ATP-binding cassette domain-containing protein [Streptomyces himalayensis]|uniref:ATP-binding cassette domain-containing protein n=1 Tax=Streptomyces himalayensis subsp. himalayensis TaxID=2756131 RepID=A0A7W0I871_9ACTN|nr:ATP-binding cassette domain-containing protein [Streptomyces himalayensis]MBA2945977.1 ATP-binding cassette domain-containing protein [Streptomyces himalayensis subsp. himalayensis]